MRLATWQDVTALLSPADAARLSQLLGTGDSQVQRELGEIFLDRATARICSWLLGADYSIPTEELLADKPLATAYLKAWTLDGFMYEISVGYMNAPEAVAAALARAERPKLRAVRGPGAQGDVAARLFYPESIPELERAP